MKLHYFALAAAIGLMPIMAAAHGPSRQKITETVEIAASPDAVWAKVGNFNDMSWHPLVFSTDDPKGNEIGATRVLTLKSADGPKITEELDKYDATKRSYKYRITNVDVAVLPVTNYAGTITVTDGENGGSHVEWRGAFYRGYPNNNPPENLNDAAAIAAVSAMYRAGLDALKASLEKPN